MVLLLLRLWLYFWLWLDLVAVGRGGRELGGCAMVFECVSVMVWFGLLCWFVDSGYVALSWVEVEVGWYLSGYT